MEMNDDDDDDDEHDAAADDLPLDSNLVGCFNSLEKTYHIVSELDHRQ